MATMPPQHQSTRCPEDHPPLSLLQEPQPPQSSSARVQLVRERFGADAFSRWGRRGGRPKKPSLAENERRSPGALLAFRSRRLPGGRPRRRPPGQ
jgi:hypothetical protein